jgi:hypothetical protein
VGSDYFKFYTDCESILGYRGETLTKTKEKKCKSNMDCYTSCSKDQSSGYYQKCMPAVWNDPIPILECAVDYMNDRVKKFLRMRLGLNAVTGTTSEIMEALKKEFAVEDCMGPTASSGACLINVDQQDCGKSRIDELMASGPGRMPPHYPDRRHLQRRDDSGDEEYVYPMEYTMDMDLSMLEFSPYTKAEGSNCRAVYFWSGGGDASESCQKLADSFQNATGITVNGPATYLRYANREDWVFDEVTQEWKWVTVEAGSQSNCEMDTKCDTEWSWDSDVTEEECLARPATEQGEYCAQCWGDTCWQWSQFPECFATYQEAWTPDGNWTWGMTKSKCEDITGEWVPNPWALSDDEPCYDCCKFKNLRTEEDCASPDVDLICPSEVIEWPDWDGTTKTSTYRGLCEHALICYKANVHKKDDCLALRGSEEEFPKWLGVESELPAGEFTSTNSSSKGVCVVDMISMYFEQ